MKKFLLFVILVACAAIASAAILHTLKGSGQAVNAGGDTAGFKVTGNQFGGTFSTTVVNGLGLHSDIDCSFFWSITFSGNTVTISGPATLTDLGGSQSGVVNATFTDGSPDSLCFTFTPDDPNGDSLSFDGNLRFGSITVT